MEKIENTERKAALIQVLQANINAFLTKEEIVKQVNGLLGYEAYIINYSSFSHDKCIALWEDIESINNDFQSDELYMIIRNSKGDIKMPTKREAVDYFNRQLSIAFKKLVRARNLQKKYRMNGLNLFMFDNEGVNIDNLNEIKVLVDEMNNDKEEK